MGVGGWTIVSFGCAALAAALSYLSFVEWGWSGWGWMMAALSAINSAFVVLDMTVMRGRR